MMKRLGVLLAALLWASAAFGQVAGMATGNGYPQGSTFLINTATGTTAGATATLAGAPGRVTYLCGYSVSPGAATAAITITVTTTGLSSNISESVGAPVAAAGTTAADFERTFPQCLQASAPNTAITVVAGALGAGGVNQAVNAWGYQVTQN